MATLLAGSKFVGGRHQFASSTSVVRLTGANPVLVGSGRYRKRFAFGEEGEERSKGFSAHQCLLLTRVFMSAYDPVQEGAVSEPTAKPRKPATAAATVEKLNALTHPRSGRLLFGAHSTFGYKLEERKVKQ